MTLATLCRDSIRRPAAPATEQSSWWSIILAGGEGRHMNPPVKDWFGESRPKQYCTLAGSRSMFQHTIDRARSIVPDDRIVSIIGQGHREFLASAARGALPGTVIEQPCDLGTAPGIFLPLAHVLARNPEANVVFFPSDHFVHPEDSFARHVMRACSLAESHRDRLILVAAVPDRPEPDYGWIRSAPLGRPGRAAAGGAARVLEFREKPGLMEARALFDEGCLWNTMIMAVRAKTLWALGRRCLPRMMRWFDAFLMVLVDVQAGKLGPEMETLAPARLFEELDAADFSREILQRAADRSMVLPMEGVDWCDWGRPERVKESLARLNARPPVPGRRIEERHEAASEAGAFQAYGLCQNRS